ncbi:MAG: methyltransferase [Kineosporiaceae bacterium]|nr:methyltransferase [Kineosporiaceae bacterium]
MVVDLCCFSGAIAGAIVRRIERIEIHAVDVDPGYVACARGNLAELAGLVEDGSTADVVTGDGYRPLALGRAVASILIVCSPPYVPTGAVATMPIEAWVFEPLRALDGGDDDGDRAARHQRCRSEAGTGRRPAWEGALLARRPWRRRPRRGQG